MVPYALNMITRERDGHPAEPDAEQPADSGSMEKRARCLRGIPGASTVDEARGANEACGAVGACDRCAQTRRTCPSCVQRRRYAWSLVIQRGETFETAGEIIGLHPARVRELVAAEQDRRELQSLRCDSIPVDRTRTVIAEALARDPDLRIADIARWLEMQQADFERAFLGKGRVGLVKRRVTVPNASRLMIALGRAPNELEGC